VLVAFVVAFLLILQLFFILFDFLNKKKRILRVFMMFEEMMDLFAEFI
jgi:hypothetical protein